MPQYAAIVSHPPDDCPMTNKAVREFSKKAYERLPDLLKKFNVKLLLDIHLDPSHKAFMLFENAKRGSGKGCTCVRRNNIFLGR